ncbi:MAG TPA: hypothetical protein VNZ58_06380, partial [Thermomicrobiales bacterium]|nr:hypothetical protein [Thermomicrobiales bacterium]
AWGLTWNHERVEKKERCTNASVFLRDATDLLPAYINAGTIGESETWLSQISSITAPGAAKDLRDVMQSSMNYAMTTDPELETTGTGEVYDTLTPFQQSIDRARNDLVAICPETATLIPDAFPMFYRTGDQ